MQFLRFVLVIKNDDPVRHVTVGLTRKELLWIILTAFM